MLNDHFALRLLATITFSAEELFLSASPTLLWDVIDEKATLFLRYNRLYERNAIEGYSGDLVFGFNYFLPFYSNQLLLSSNPTASAYMVALELLFKLCVRIS